MNRHREREREREIKRLTEKRSSSERMVKRVEDGD
jgi:hypothetical protein